MRQSTAKATRRDIRRAMGERGVGAVAEVQGNQETLANSLASAHQAIAALEHRHVLLVETVEQLRQHVKKIY